MFMIITKQDPASCTINYTPHSLGIPNTMLCIINYDVPSLVLYISYRLSMTYYSHSC